MATPPIETQKSEYYSGAQPTGQAPQQMQSGTTQPMFQTAIPLASLQKAPAPVDCPICHTRAMTRTEFHSGNTTQYVLPQSNSPPNPLPILTQPPQQNLTPVPQPKN